MKGVVLTLVIVILVVIAGFTVVNALQDDSNEITEELPSCGNSCTSGNSCGSSTCGVEKTGSCGCGRS
jgi:hypothetical protein